MSSDMPGLPAAPGTPVLTSIHERAHQTLPCTFLHILLWHLFFRLNMQTLIDRDPCQNTPRSRTHTQTHVSSHAHRLTLSFTVSEAKLLLFLQEPLAARMERQEEKLQREAEREREGRMGLSIMLSLRCSFSKE